MASSSTVTRATARALVLSGDGRVLLIRHAVERDGYPFVFWAPPGGRIEQGETAEAAVRRELWEELQLDLAVDGPVHIAVDQFSDGGVLVATSDTFFVAKCDQSAVSPHGVTAEEVKALAEARWWAIEAIERSAEKIFPPNLAALVRPLIAANKSASGLHL